MTTLSHFEKSIKAGLTSAAEISHSLAMDLKMAEEAFAARELSRQETRSKRQEAADDEDAGLTKEERSAKKKNRVQLEKSLTRMLVTLAEVGDLEGIKRAVAAGGSLEKALDRSKTPLEAALEANQMEMARWLLSQPELHFGLRRVGALRSCLTHDAVDVFEGLCLRFPEIKAQQLQDLRKRAYHLKTAPKLALTLDKKLADMGQEPRQEESWSALAGALNARDWDTAREHLKPLSQQCMSGSRWAARAWTSHKWTPCAGSFFSDLFSADDAVALVFMIKEAPYLMLSFAAVGPSVEPYVQMSNFVRGHNNSALLDRVTAYQNGSLKIPFAILAARSNAKDCLDILLSLKAFKEPLLRSQAEPEAFLWEEAFFAVSSVESYSALGKAGFDFKKKMADQGNYLHAAFAAERFAKTLIERMGRDHSEFIEQKDENNQTPLMRIVMRRPYLAGKAQKAEAVFQKAAIKSVSKPGSRKKEVRAAAVPRRL